MSSKTGNWMVFALLAITSAGACAKKEAAPTPPPATPPLASDAAVPAPAPAATVAPEVRHGIPWFEDAPEAALAEARAKKRPVLVDLWAPWCHTCLSMQEYILTDEKLPGAKDQFVFLAVNTEKAENAKFLETVPVEVWPTFYVLDADGPAIRGRWLGSGSPQQFSQFLADGRRAQDMAHTGDLPPGDPLVMLLAGDALAAQKKFAEAAAKYGEVLQAAPKDWPRRPDALVARASALLKAKDAGACADLALASMDETGNAVSAADFAYYGVACADELDAKDARKQKAYTVAEKRLAALCLQDGAQLTPDDRADACANLREAREALGDKAGAKKAAEKQLAVLEAGSQGTPNEVALTYDWNRADTLYFLGRGDEALGLVIDREKALPDSYLPPHYQARLYQKMKKWDLGLAAIDRALAKAYGPRKAGMLSLKADLLLGAGKKDEAKKVVEEQLAAFQALPPGQKQPAREAAIAKQLAEWK
jgi:thiol-disulfide isomerase/thioredoxin